MMNILYCFKQIAENNSKTTSCRNCKNQPISQREMALLQKLSKYSVSGALARGNYRANQHFVQSAEKVQKGAKRHISRLNLCHHHHRCPHRHHHHHHLQHPHRRHPHPQNHDHHHKWEKSAKRAKKHISSSNLCQEMH